MNKTDIQKGKMVYYARMLKPVGIYEVCDLQECLDTVLEAEKNAPKISDEQEYEEY